MTAAVTAARLRPDDHRKGLLPVQDRIGCAGLWHGCAPAGAVEWMSRGSSPLPSRWSSATCLRVSGTRVARPAPAVWPAPSAGVCAPGAPRLQAIRHGEEVPVCAFVCSLQLVAFSDYTNAALDVGERLGSWHSRSIPGRTNCVGGVGAQCRCGRYGTVIHLILLLVLETPIFPPPNPWPSFYINWGFGLHLYPEFVLIYGYIFAADYFQRHEVMNSMHLLRLLGNTIDMCTEPEHSLRGFPVAWDGVNWSPLGTQTTRIPIVPAPDDRRVWNSRWNDKW